MSCKRVSLVESLQKGVWGGEVLLKLQLLHQPKLKQIECNLLRKSVGNRKRYETQLILARGRAKGLRVEMGGGQGLGACVSSIIKLDIYNNITVRIMRGNLL